MIEHVIKLGEEKFATPWRSIEGRSGDPSHAGYLLAGCEKHRDFRVRLFHNGYNKYDIEMERDRQVREHLGKPKIVYDRYKGEGIA